MPAVLDQLHNEVDEIIPGLIADRRHLHEHPELGFREFQTARFIVDRLTSLGAEELRGGVGKTGVTALIRGTLPGAGKTVLLRADMDALPIHELNNVAYRSQQDGVMHACGHDAHVAMLLAAARLLMNHRDQFAGTVKLLFQPAEEGQGGAMAMIADGALVDPAPDATFGLHIWQHADIGIVEVRDGVAMVAADGFAITIKGRGGHGARPQRSIDPIVAGAAIVNAIQQLVSRESDPTLPAVITVGSFHAGNAANVIPDAAVLRGTIRSVTPEQRQELAERLQALAVEIGRAMRTDVQVDIDFGVPPTVNDPAMAAVVRKAALAVVGSGNVVDGPLKVVSEDYSEFLEQVPGCFFFVGSRNVKRGLEWGHHNARFDIDEEALGIGAEVMTRTALLYLEESAEKRAGGE